MRRAAGLLAEVYMLLSHTASDIEATRIGTNQHLTSLADRRSVDLSTVNPHLQATVLESQKQAVVYSALMNRANASLGASSRFFLPGGSDGATTLSATPSPYSTIASVAPYDPALLSVLALPQSQLPAQANSQPSATPTSTSSTASSTTHTNDQPNRDNRNGGYYKNRNYYQNNSGDRNRTFYGGNRSTNKWFNRYKDSRDRRDNNSNYNSDRKDSHSGGSRGYNNSNNSYNGGRRYNK
jgi:hypothetical protein